MAKKESSVCSACPPHKCLRWWGIVLTLVGLLYLANDLGWNVWMPEWYTVAFLMVGLCKLCWSYAME